MVILGSRCVGGIGGISRVIAITAVLLVTTTVQAEPNAKLIPFWDDREPDSVLQIDHTAWQAILDKYLNDEHPSGINRFNYAGVTTGDYEALTAYLTYLQLFEPRQLNAAEQKAYWLNLYNAQAVAMVIEGVRRGDLKSMRSLGAGVFASNPWTRDVLNIVMQDLSLDDIFHGILRPIYQDRRVHFALSYASMGSGNLLKTAFTSGNVESLLDKAESEFLAHPRAARLDEDGRVILSSIFDWYDRDFASNKRGLFEYLKGGINPTVARALIGRPRIRFRYDWDLNN